MMFHAKDGWYFERLEDGSVRLTKKHYPYDNFNNLPETVEEVVFSAELWASVVASVSKQGEENSRFYEALKFHNEPGMLVRTDFLAMCDEIKAYTTEHPGEIISADLPQRLMLGFIHDDGTYWVIRLSDVKRSFKQTNSDEEIMIGPVLKSDLISRAVKTTEGKIALCAALSNPKKNV